ncbi:S-layer homology domain-containing protein [Thermohalobacter berrensis]|uniref:S-layer homology domain-containing protein n=1 Tax=Thermohalobacter berrensis TaxID=99594 RepID=UPI0016045DFE|nr:S-layer homology domain-containing protein [Thermohalobacter berrensis]
MHKKLFSVLLILLLIFTSTVLAVENAQQLESAEKLLALGIVTGYEDGSLKLENLITRAEFTALIVRLLPKQYDIESYEKDTIFSDVTKEHWASKYINIAVEEGLLNGYGDGTFKPDRKISYDEVLAVLVRILGYDKSLDKDKEWPLNYIDKATELGIVDNMVIPAEAKIPRGDVFVLVDNSLLIKLNKKY